MTPSEFTMTAAEMQDRIIKLETRVETLERELDHAQAVAGIKRGLAQADAGMGISARQWADKVRAKHKLPAP
jgi:hypothetical protein